MGRYITPSDTGGGTMRTESHILTASNAAVPVPAWAKIVYVSGTGGGGGGGNALTAGIAGNGGHSAGSALRALVLLNGAATVAVAIGAGGAGAAAGSNSLGGAGGDTVVTIGSAAVTMRGGGTNISTARALAFFGTVDPGGTSGSGVVMPDNGSPVFILGTPGFDGADGANSGTRKGSGGHTPFGAGGPGFTGTVATGQVGNAATGYGSGGSGGNGSGAGGNGAPGMVTLEFAEGI